MNTYVTFACLLAVFGLSQGSAIGIGTPLIGSVYPAISSVSVVKTPISVIRPIVTAPVVAAPVLTTSLGLGHGIGLGGVGHSLSYGGAGVGVWGNWGGHGKYYG